MTEYVEDERRGLLQHDLEEEDEEETTSKRNVIHLSGRNQKDEKNGQDDDNNGKDKDGGPGGLNSTAMLVIVAEFAERCCYYAITAIYVVYMQTMLGFSASEINATTSAFNFAGYTFVLLGGWVADKALGRRKTILVFGLIYLLALIFLSISASPAGFANFPYNPSWAVWGFVVSLVLIALGMGGIKANVGPLMADQLGPNSSSDQLETAFRYFYWSINFGALLGMLLSPLVKRIGPTFPPQTNATTLEDVCTSSSDPYTGYYIAFALFTGMFVCGIVAFLWGYKSFLSHPPSGSLLTRVFALCMLARRERLQAKAKWTEVPPHCNHWLDWAKVSCNAEDSLFVDDLKQTFRALLVFSVLPVYWLLYLQMSNTLVLQASMMYLPGHITPDQMAALDPAFLVFLIPLFDSCIFPALKRAGIKPNAIQRMSIGFCLVAFAMLIAGGLQAAINTTGTFVNCSGEEVFKVNSGGGVNVFAQVPIYFLISVSEIFASITSLEFAYSEAPKKMKSLVMAYSLFQTAIGSLLGLILTPVVTEPNFIWLFLSFGCAMLFFTIIFYYAFRSYHEQQRT